MDFPHLASFVAVAEEFHFSRATISLESHEPLTKR